MSFTALALSIVAAWCVIGIVVSVWMRRRGHALFTWAYLGAVLGPLVVPLAIDAVARERRARTAPSGRLATDDGRVSVLVGIDGSDESLAAARAARALLAERIGRLTLAAVVDYDAASGRPSESRREAETHLEVAAGTIGVTRSERIVLVGSPADALALAARDGDFDLLVIGSRGRGASHALLGSVASRLARGVGVPVLVCDASRSQNGGRLPAKAGEVDPT
jgi:Universal stress protein UspA and related nucleotide-binding proteins